jgi:flagellar basal-body rod protein FlgB
MNDISISDDAIVAALGRQMTAAVAKQVVAASNLANVDTPGYRAKDVSFDDVFAQEMAKGGLATTNPAHMTAAGNELPPATEVEGLQARRDGNTVQIDRELLQMTKASTDFTAAQTALAAKFRLIRYAISEVR